MFAIATTVIRDDVLARHRRQLVEEARGHRENGKSTDEEERQ